MDGAGWERRNASAASGPSTLTAASIDDQLTPDARVESLVTHGEMAYYTRADGCLVAVDTDAGAIEWIRQVAPEAAGRYPRGPWVCLTDQYVIVGGTDVTGYNRLTGEHEITYIDRPTAAADGSGRPTLWRPVVLPSDAVVAARGTEAVCVDSTGCEQWRYELDPSAPTSPFSDAEYEPDGTEAFYHPAADDDTVYLLVRNVVAYVPEPCVDGEIHAITHDGEHRWTASRSGHVQRGEPAPAVTVGDTGVYLSQYASSGTPSGHGVSRFNKESGTLEWEHSQSGGELAYDGERLFATNCWEKSLTCFDPATGTIAWESEVPATTKQHHVAPRDGALVLGSEYAYAVLDGVLALVDKPTGDVRETRQFEHHQPTGFVLHGRSLYYGTADGALHELGEEPQVDMRSFCPACGQDLGEVSPAAFCPNCGTEL